MRALVLQDWWKLGVEDRPEPVAAPGEILVRPVATGICGSDIHGYTGENGRRSFGQVMGHETVGTVEAVGAEVDVQTAPAVGAVVTINPVIGCGHCEMCRSGNAQACATKSVIGVTASYTSAFAELVSVPAANVVALPAGTPIDYGALVEPLAVGYHAARRGGIGPGSKVLVIGGGPIGQACILAALRLGADAVAVSELNEHRRSLCASLGAQVIDPGEPGSGSVAEAASSVLDGAPSVVLDAVGTSGSMAAALDAAPLMSTVVLVGMGSPALDVPAYEVSTKERSIVGSFCYTPAEFAETAAWVGTTDLNLGALIEGRVDLVGANEAFESLARGDGTISKVLVMVQE
jgi:threonine dehydrogenase-like Zn-dependent dehydrogenase